MPDQAAPANRFKGLLRPLTPVGVWLAGIAAAIVAALVTAWLLPQETPTGTPAPAASTPSASPEIPFTVAVRTSHDPLSGWIVDRPPAGVPPRPTVNGDWTGWSQRAAGVPARGTHVLATVQGRSAGQVTLTGLRVRVVHRRPPLAGTLVYVMGGSGDGYYRWVSIDLDSDPPKLLDVIDEDFAGDTPAHERRPIRFPYRVSITDAETFLLAAHSENCLCEWVFELDWAAEGRVGTLVVDDAGKPFRLTSIAAAYARCGVWGRNPGEEICE